MKGERNREMLEKVRAGTLRSPCHSSQCGREEEPCREGLSRLRIKAAIASICCALGFSEPLLEMSFDVHNSPSCQVLISQSQSSSSKPTQMCPVSPSWKGWKKALLFKYCLNFRLVAGKSHPESLWSLGKPLPRHKKYYKNIRIHQREGVKHLFSPPRSCQHLT